MKNHYNSTELKEFKALILNKLSSAKEELKILQQSLSNQSNDTSDTCRSWNPLEVGSDTLSKEEIGIMAQKQSKFIKALEAALIRIENKTYGICSITGDLIPKQRLLAVPHTTVTIQHKQK